MKNEKEISKERLIRVRKLEAKMAESVNLLGAEPLTKDDQKFVDMYTEGKISHEELIQLIEERYKQEEENN